MDRYLRRTMCRSCSGKDRGVTAVSAFCGLGTEQPLKAEQGGPDLSGSRQCNRPPESQIIPQLTPKFQLGVSLYPSKLGSSRVRETARPGRQKWSYREKAGKGL